MSTPFELAVKMQSLGYTVIPGGGGPTGKKPLVEWKIYETKGTTLDQVLDWEDSLHPKAWGIVTGSHNGTFEIDDDTPGGSPLFNGNKPHVLTPRKGTHRFYKYPNFKIITKAGILPGIDSRGEGGYSQFAGVTPDGEYQLLELPMPDTLPTFDDLPAVLKDALRNTSESSTHNSKKQDTLFCKGERNDKLFRIASGLRNKGMSEDNIYEAVKAFYENDCVHEPEIKDDELRSIAKGSGKYQPGDMKFNLTDLGNAERLVAQFGETVRFCYERKLWLIWQGTHWQWDYTGEIMRIAQKTARSIYNEAANEADDTKRDLIAKWAHQSESNMRLSAMIAQAQPMVSIKIDQLDCNEWLLNCNNGTINLKTGDLQPHNPSDYITRKIETNFDPNASSEVWYGFLSRVFEDKTELIDFIQRALGYSITGNQGEQAIFFCHGGGWNCKSTLLGAVRRVLGPYASEIDPAAFMVDKHRGTGPNEAIASLYKVNFVTSVEIEDGQKFSTSLLKRMTGGESLRCERKFEHGFNFIPQYKLWLSGNHEPEIDDTTNSIWHRIKKIPFKANITDSERIKDYDQILAKEHGEAMLAWLVQGCLDWQEHGLGESQEVKDATQAYRDSQDVLHDFLTENCQIKGSETVQIAVLYKAYTEWCESNGDKYFLGKHKFNARMLEKGFVKLPGTANKTVWRGLRLLTNDEKS